MILLALGLAAAPLGEAAWEDGKKRLKPLTDDTKGKVLAALPAKATAKPKKPRRILVFYRCETFVHGSIVAGNFAMQELGRKTGAYTADLADEYSVSSASLARGKASPASTRRVIIFTDGKPARG